MGRTRKGQKKQVVVGAGEHVACGWAWGSMGNGWQGLRLLPTWAGGIMGDISNCNKVRCTRQAEGRQGGMGEQGASQPPPILPSKTGLGTGSPHSSQGRQGRGHCIPTRKKAALPSHLWHPPPPPPPKGREGRMGKQGRGKKG